MINESGFLSNEETIPLKKEDEEILKVMSAFRQKLKTNR
tara:strand:+ start:409 stop:525 length:117 start_codon:yes stop_codon:yes gene_type:complete